MWAATATVKKNIPIIGIPKGTIITITKGIKYKYAIWWHDGIYDLPAHYIDPKSIDEFFKQQQ